MTGCVAVYIVRYCIQVRPTANHEARR